MKARKKNYFFLGMIVFIYGCSPQHYEEKPISGKVIQGNYAVRSLQSPIFQAYLSAQENIKLPVLVWGQQELYYITLFFHPDMEVVRAELKVAESAEVIAKQYPDPKFNLFIQRHDNNSKSPWTHGIGIDILLDVANKREIRLDRAKFLTEDAKTAIAQTMWRLRDQLSKDLLMYQYSLRLISVLQEIVKTQAEIVHLIEDRVRIGIESQLVLEQTQLTLKKNETALLQEQGKFNTLRVQLSRDLGIPVALFNTLEIDKNNPWEYLEPLPENRALLQEEMLKNRLDIRSALFRYAAVESKLRLEIAKQYPDIILSPSYLYDQGDNIWALGLSGLMTFISGNKGLIEEAKALREVEGKKFELLQIQAISELNKALVHYQDSYFIWQKSNTVLSSERKVLKNSEDRFTQGFADKLTLKSTQLSFQIALQEKLAAQYQLQLAGIELENILQKPLLEKFKGNS